MLTCVCVSCLIRATREAPCWSDKEMTGYRPGSSSEDLLCVALQTCPRSTGDQASSSSPPPLKVVCSCLYLADLESPRALYTIGENSRSTSSQRVVSLQICYFRRMLTSEQGCQGSSDTQCTHSKCWLFNSIYSELSWCVLSCVEMRDPLPPCGIRENLPADRIIYGQQALPHSWPWMAYTAVNIHYPLQYHIWLGTPSGTPGGPRTPL